MVHILLYKNFKIFLFCTFVISQRDKIQKEQWLFLKKKVKQFSMSLSSYLYIHRIFVTIFQSLLSSPQIWGRFFLNKCFQS